MEQIDIKPKLFKLPKPFAKKWLKALRGDKYKQTDGQLLSSSDYKPTFANSGFCCLGVAGHLCGYKMKELEGAGFLLKEIFGNAPIEIQGDAEGNKLVQILSALNDGIGKSEKVAYEELGYIFREVEEHGFQIKFTFPQIADFIEDNVEFYAVPKVKKEK